MKKIKPEKYDMFFCVPLEIPISKKKNFILNQNNYRNAHFRVLSKAKENYKNHIFSLRLEKKQYQNSIRCHYIYYSKSNRTYDSMNLASIIDKFLMDALIEYGLLKDDNYKLVLFPTFIHGGIDNNYPRCEVYIEEIIY